MASAYRDEAFCFKSSSFLEQQRCYLQPITRKTFDLMFFNFWRKRNF